MCGNNVCLLESFVYVSMLNKIVLMIRVDDLQMPDLIDSLLFLKGKGFIFVYLGGPEVVLVLSNMSMQIRAGGKLTIRELCPVFRILFEGIVVNNKQFFPYVYYKTKSEDIYYFQNLHKIYWLDHHIL